VTLREGERRLVTLTPAVAAHRLAVGRNGVDERMVLM
jgi:hypothetical protein